jgi:hypothetical protein
LKIKIKHYSDKLINNDLSAEEIMKKRIKNHQKRQYLTPQKTKKQGGLNMSKNPYCIR